MSLTPFAWGMIAAAAGALLVLATRQGTAGASLWGFLVSGAMVLGFGPGVMAPVTLFVLGSGLLTRAGRARKERFRAAEPDRGRRRAAHVLAKLGVPALLGALAALDPSSREMAGSGAAAALAAAFADTASTEVGPLAGGRVWRLGPRGIEAANHGSAGGVSVLGLIAGALAALGLAALARAVDLGIPEGAPFFLAAAGFGATLVESILGGMGAGKNLGHFGRNIALSAIAALAGCAGAALRLGPSVGP
jgi:uncharacterized membrane protein